MVVILHRGQIYFVIASAPQKFDTSLLATRRRRL
jgi:hypothetical protein